MKLYQHEIDHQRLRDAAPDLLEALMAITPTAHIGETEMHKAFYAKARAAIAKATGAPQ